MEKQIDEKVPSGNPKADMIAQLNELIELVSRGDITCFMACGLHANNDIWGAVVIPEGTSGTAMHAAVIQLHETYHEMMDEAANGMAKSSVH